MRRRLAVLVAATTSLVVIAFLAPLVPLLREIAADRAVAVAAGETQSIAALAGISTPDQLRDVVDAANAGGARTTSVLLPGTAGTLGPPVPDSPGVALARAGRALSVDTAGGREILVPVETAGGRAVVRTLVPAATLSRGVPPAVGTLVGLGLVLVLVAVFVADRLARWTLRPVGALSAAARRLARGELDARVVPGGPPEIAEVCRAVNVLAGRIGDLLARERETIADLSHRLRTPLTALRLEAHQLAEPDRARMLRLVGGVEAAVDRLIAEARRTGAGAGGLPADAVAVVGRRVGFWSPLAEDQGRRLALSLPRGPRWVRLGAEDLEAVVDALVQNVLAHTPEGTDFAVAVVPLRGGGSRLVVTDAGPGLPRADVVRRGSSGRGSTGLGLDIARRAAEASGGGLSLGRSPAGGAQVSVDLGAAAT